MVEIIATVESIEQAKQLLPYVDTIFFGEETFGLRLPTSFSREEQSELIRLAQAEGKQGGSQWHHAPAKNDASSRILGFFEGQPC